jgi:hypothetical protein
MKAQGQFLTWTLSHSAHDFPAWRLDPLLQSVTPPLSTHTQKLLAIWHNTNSILRPGKTIHGLHVDFKASDSLHPLGHKPINLRQTSAFNAARLARFQAQSPAEWLF